MLATAVLVAAPRGALAQQAPDELGAVYGVKLRIGGRYDNVRMCVASAPGAEGGLAADISLFADIPLNDRTSVEVDLPVMRPILFGAAFKMLQFEPSVALKFRRVRADAADFVGGPVLGLSLHYGPDYESGLDAGERGSDFFALGPTVGGYLGFDFDRPEPGFNFQLGLTPYVTGLFGVDDPEDHIGVVVGALLDGSFRFDPS